MYVPLLKKHVSKLYDGFHPHSTASHVLKWKNYYVLFVFQSFVLTYSYIHDAVLFLMV